MKINILYTGTPPVQIENKFGTTGEWVGRLLLKNRDIRTINYTGKRFVTRHVPDAWILAGSFLSVTDTTDRMQLLIDEIRKLLRLNVPILGICFGHQLIGVSMGGKVECNAKGMEIGFSKIKITDAGRKTELFKNIPNLFFACQSHTDTLTEPPAGSVILANNAYGIQSVRYKECVYGVQFHPECNSDMIHTFLDYYGIDKPAPFRDGTSPDLTSCRQVLFNFFNAIRKEKKNAVTTL